MAQTEERALKKCFFDENYTTLSIHGHLKFLSLSQAQKITQVNLP